MPTQKQHHRHDHSGRALLASGSLRRALITTNENMGHQGQRRQRRRICADPGRSIGADRVSDMRVPDRHIGDRLLRRDSGSPSDLQRVRPLHRVSTAWRLNNRLVAADRLHCAFGDSPIDRGFRDGRGSQG